MTLLVTEGFDQGNAGTTWWNAGQSRWNQSINFTSGCYPDTNAARHGGFGLRYGTGGGEQAIWRSIVNTNPVIQGHAIWHAPGDGYQFRALFRFRAQGTIQVTVHYDYTNSRILVYRGDGALYAGTLIGQSASGVHTADSAWHYWECKTFIDATTGYVIVKRDGVTVVNLTNVNTLNNVSAAYVDRVECVTASSSANSYFDDVYVCDTNGTTNNDFLGDITIETLHPNGNGTYSQMMGSDLNTTNNYQLVNDWDDATWTDATNTGETDSYAYGNSGYSAPSTILGVVVTARAYKTDTGARSVAQTAIVGGSTTQTADHSFSGTGVYAIIDVMETRPGGGAWTTTDVNNAEFGVIARP